MHEKFQNLEGRTAIDTFLARQRHMITQASMMADQKASISLALQLGLLTLIVHQFTGSNAAGGLTFSKVWWLSPMAFSTLISVVLCLYVLMPSIGPRGRQEAPPQPAARKSPLFFSRIAQMEEDEFLNEMGDLFQSDGRIYEAVLIDMHRESLVLHRKKYRFLELSYRCFLIGILLTAFCVAVKIAATGIASLVQGAG